MTFNFYNKGFILKKIFFIFFIFANFLFAQGIAIVKMAKGNPVVKRDDKIINLKVGDELLNNDILITDANSKVGVIFDDGSSLTLGESSYLNIEEFKFKPIEEIYKFSLKLDKGKAMFESGKVSEISPESFEFKIPDGIIGIRGTKFIIELK